MDGLCLGWLSYYVEHIADSCGDSVAEFSFVSQASLFIFIFSAVVVVLRVACRNCFLLTSEWLLLVCRW
ncbi:hypothetical protein DSUL_20064 [Desulfovibrionales bacterium]